MTAKSSLSLFLFYRYFFLFMGVQSVVVFVPEMDAEMLITLVPQILMLIAIFLLSIKYVFRAEVSKQEVRFGDIVVPWNEAKKLFRVGQLYYLKTIDNEVFLFPIQQPTIRLFWNTIDQTDMDQIIQMIRKKHNL